MKRYLPLLFAVLLLGLSCSTDKDENGEASDSIIGSWDATALEIDNATASDDAKNARDILSFLTARDCYIITLRFREDLTVETEDSVNYLEINVNSGGTGLDIPCPTDNDMDSSTYTYENGTLTYVDSDQQTVTIEVDISGNTMRVDARELDIPNFNDSGQLVFTRR